MLGKLLKHEFKATSSYLLPIYGILILLSVVTRFILSLSIFQKTLSPFAGLLQAGHIIYMVATVIITIILMVFRFYNNLVTDEGYLMHTLPVTANQLIISKLIPAITWIIVSVITVIGSVIITYATPTFLSDLLSELRVGMDVFNREYGAYRIVIIIGFVLLILLGIIHSILMIYCSIACGQLFTGHKLIGSFVSYAAINTITSIVSTIGVAVLSLLRINTEIEGYINHMPTIGILNTFLFGLIIGTLIWGLIYYFLTRYLMTNKLNLE